MVLGNFLKWSTNSANSAFVDTQKLFSPIYFPVSYWPALWTYLLWWPRDSLRSFELLREFSAPHDWRGWEKICLLHFLTLVKTVWWNNTVKCRFDMGREAFIFVSFHPRMVPDPVCLGAEYIDIIVTSYSTQIRYFVATPGRRLCRYPALSCLMWLIKKRCITVRRNEWHSYILNIC